MCSFSDDSELKTVKYPRYLRKKQKLKLKLNDISVNNQSPDLKVLPYVPDVRLDTLSMSNNQGNKGRLVNINKSDNKNNNSNVLKKKDNKIIYRLPTPNDILRSKNVNVPKVKKIDRNVLKRINNRLVLENVNSQVNKDSSVVNRNEKTEVHPSIAITSQENAVNKSATNKLYESLKTNNTNLPPSSSNIDHEIQSAWAKFKEDESWKVKMKEMVTKQISIDSKRLKNNAKKEVSLNDVDDSIEHVEEMFEMKLVDDDSIMESASFSSKSYENDHSNFIHMNTIVETNKESNDSDVSQENISCMKSASQIDEYDKSSNETFIVSIDHLNEESNLESPTLTYSFIEDFTLQTRTVEDAVLKSSTNKEGVTYTSDPTSSNQLSDHILNEKSDNDDSNENHNFMNEDMFEDIVKPTNTEKVNDIIKDFFDSVSKTKSQLNQDYMTDNAEHLENNYNQKYVLQTSNWILNTSNATKLPCESLATTFLEIMNDVEGIYENMQSCGSYNDGQFSPWTYLDSTNIDEDYTTLVTNYNFQEQINKFNGNKIIELSDSEDERQIEETKYIVRNTNRESLSVIHKKELNQYKIIYNGSSTVYTIFSYLHSFLFCVPLFLTMNISLNAVSTICNFTRECDRYKKKMNPTRTNTNFGKKIILLPLRKISQINDECEMKTELDKTHSVIRSSEFSTSENLIFKESQSNPAINFEYSLEQSSNLLPNSDDQLYLNLHPLNDNTEDNTLTTRIEDDVIAKQEDSKSDSFSLDTPEYYFEKENGNPHKFCSIHLSPRNDDSSMERFFSSDNDYNSTDHVCNSSDESIWGDNESKYFASCSSLAFSDVDYQPERCFNYYYPITYSTDKDNFTVHKKKIEYYEKIEYKKDPLDYRTVKTNFAKLPLLNNQYGSNKECKRNWNSPPYSSKWIDNRISSGRVPKKNRTSKPKALEKLPPLVSRIMKQSTSDINKYDPFESAEQQMMELFSADSQRESTNGKNRKNDNSSTTIHNNNNNVYKPSTVSPGQITPDLQKSSSTTPTKSPTPISAFALYTRKSTPTDNLSAAVDDDINKKINDNELAIDEDNNRAIENRTSSPIAAFINKPLDELEKELLLNNLECCSVVSIDSVVDSNKSAPLLSLAGGKYLRSNSDIVAPKLRKPTGECVGKSNSAGSGRSSNKYKLNMQQMLFGDGPPPSHASNSNLSLTVDKPSSEDINAATVGLLEECEAELMLELEKMLTAQSSTTSTTITPPSPQLPSIQSSFAICSSDDQPETMDKLSGDKRSVGNTTIDSAYSSLTRVLSEGGGGGGFSGGGGKDTFKLEQSRFCHECGTQYPVAVAKFCCYCGMRRIAI